MSSKLKPMSEARADRERQRARIFLSIFGDLDRRVKRYESKGSWAYAGIVVAQAKKDFEQVSERKLRSQYLGELKKRYPTYFKEAIARGAKVSNSGDVVWDILCALASSRSYSRD